MADKTESLGRDGLEKCKCGSIILVHPDLGKRCSHWPLCPSRDSVFRSMGELLSNPRALDPPRPVVPRLAWQGRLTLLAGREKGGKSTLAGAATAAVTKGATFLECPTLEGTVLYVHREEHKGEVLRRFDRFGADNDSVFLTDRIDLATLDQEVPNYKPVLIVIDTLAAFVGGAIDDPGNSAKWTPILQGFVALARDHDAAVLLLHHARRSDGSYRDSSAIGAAPDALIEMREDTKDRWVRQLSARARWEVPDCNVRLTAGGYVLAAGEDLSLDARVLDFVRVNAGCSLRRLVNGIAGRAKDTQAAVHALLKSHALVNEGGGRGMALRVPGHAPGNGYEP
jgi:hypothetical protein